MAVVEVVTSVPKVVVGGFVIETAPTVTELHAVLGSPSRIDSGAQPVPVGHRNNQIHVYSYQFGGFAIHVHTSGRKLPSGRRSRARQVIEVSISWPHDNWGAPAEADC
jgi:hypothetical protein